MVTRSKRYPVANAQNVAKHTILPGQPEATGNSPAGTAPSSVPLRTMMKIFHQTNLYVRKMCKISSND